MYSCILNDTDIGVCRALYRLLHKMQTHIVCNAWQNNLSCIVSNSGRIIHQLAVNYASASGILLLKEACQWLQGTACPSCQMGPISWPWQSTILAQHANQDNQYHTPIEWRIWHTCKKSA